MYYMEPRSPHGKGQFWGLSDPLKSIGNVWCGVRSERVHSILNNGMTADCNVPDLSVLHCIVPYEKYAPAMRSFVKILYHLFIKVSSNINMLLYGRVLSWSLRCWSMFDK